ncbi:methyltransferase domain-containing protein [Cylindrospermum sp. FACHB-282]|uniref:methyltransferase domain-containing protein n=1 Tax=Cylindrospermum sp. FACHB-282 TaxID=2692794 RepID=UPI0016884CA7|nr:methyltransferase domain-containing protein [Cylindrospermum sp. FACHB-282]MBD2385043.1 methyltransferase domain-containing protein [Cylindrospermum sp. FACHB-282]
MNSQENQEVFISWTGALGKRIALYLRDYMLQFYPLNPWVSDADITAGAAWFNATNRALERASFGVVCLTPGSSKRPWVNFETGILFGKLNNCKLVTFGEKLSNPLQQLQSIDGIKKDEWVSLLQEMTNRSRRECEVWIQSQFPEFEDKVLRLVTQSPYEYMSEMDRTIGSLQDTVDQLKNSEFARQNICFQQVILHSFIEIKTRATNSISSYTVPASQYPEYLIFLQKKINPFVKAVALVNVEEQFWQQTLGKEILKTSNEDNIRVFVFTTEDQFIQMFDTLQDHANRYRVYAMRLSILSREFGPSYSKDFSIIEASGSKILADYDNIQGYKSIRFTADQHTVSIYEKVLNSMVRKAVFIPKNIRNDNDMGIEKLKNLIFNPPNLIDYDTKTIEMSLYIDVEDYDKHEEKHAYFQDMMRRMIEIFMEHSNHNHHPSSILELGAGTGIFTSRLANLSNINKIVTIEIDWHCYKKLLSKFRRYKGKIEAVHEDSRTYDPLQVFDYIFSSFADHHIRITDKEQYFENIKRNIKPGGLIIVGDEFIPEHNLNDKESRDCALKAYHNHIIDIAKQQEELILATLEQEALDSGLREIGDFKISCEQYEQLLKRVGLEFKKEKIGPLDRDDVGGIYVYTIWLPN